MGNLCERFFAPMPHFASYKELNACQPVRSAMAVPAAQPDDQAHWKL